MRELEVIVCWQNIGKIFWNNAFQFEITLEKKMMVLYKDKGKWLTF